MRIWTAGHSTRSLRELVELLAPQGVTAIADVRRFPASRRHPHFNREPFAEALATHGIRYEWLGEGLGGRRRELVPAERSDNRAWQVAAFRHYADAMDTAEFQSGLTALEALARERPTAFLCAERLWWQCHRRLLADCLLARGWEVVHLLDPGKTDRHELTPWGRVCNGRVTYPALL